MKYPLSPEAKEVARVLTQAWDSSTDAQYLLMRVDFNGLELGRVHMKIPNTDEHPGISVRSILELATYGLLRVDRGVTTSNVMPTFGYHAPIYEEKPYSLHILLLQELRNAVATDFEVSEYFLTLNAVGNIIINSTVKNAVGVGLALGDVHQSIQELADTVEATLGNDILNSQIELREAISALRDATGDKQSKVGRVISELGRCLEHTAHAAEVTAAILVVAPFLQQLMTR